MKHEVRGRIWLETEKGMHIGEGRVALMERIQQFGSITEAAKSMKMSYRRAWQQIDAMNKANKKPLVIKVSGGNGGGGSLVTKEGEKIIHLYRSLCKKFDRFKKQQSSAGMKVRKK